MSWVLRYDQKPLHTYFFIINKVSKVKNGAKHLQINVLGVESV